MLTSLLFTACHCDHIRDPSIAVESFILSNILGGWAEITGNLTLSMIFHAYVNLGAGFATAK
jgi:hypothetical protein